MTKTLNMWSKNQQRIEQEETNTKEKEVASENSNNKESEVIHWLKKMLLNAITTHMMKKYR